MTDTEIKREKTFSEELPCFKERIKEIFDNFDNPDGYADALYLCALSDSSRIVRKAEEEINRQQEEIEKLMERIAEVSKTIKSEAIKEFAKRLKRECLIDRGYEILHEGTIDNLVKEMTEVDE